MQTSHSRVRRLGILIVIVVGSVLAYDTFANRAAAPQPTVVGVVRLNELLEGLEQRASAEARIKSMRDKLVEDANKRKDELEAKRKEVEAAPKSNQAALSDDLTLAAIRNQAWLEVSQQELDEEAALTVEDLYRSIKNAVKELAISQGYDLVMVDDSNTELVKNRTSQMPLKLQLEQQVAQRKFIYVDEATDITDQLVQRMNNAFKAAGGGGSG
jgi:Skp family chaperone for outer membrane proteins